MPIGSYELTINKGNIPLIININCEKATDEKQYINIHLACPKCNNRIKQKNICINPKCENYEKEISFTETKKLVCLDEKNTELQRSFTQDEYKKIFEKQKTTRIEIIGITETEKINRIGIFASYYLTPKIDKKDKTKSNENEYFFAMLKEAIKNKYALVGKIMLKNKENLCYITDYENILLLQMIYYNDEIRTTKQYEPPNLTTQDKQMAREWINQIIKKENFDFGLLVNENKQTIIKKCLDLIKNKDIPVIKEETKPKITINPFAQALNQQKQKKEIEITR